MSQGRPRETVFGPTALLEWFQVTVGLISWEECSSTAGRCLTVWDEGSWSWLIMGRAHATSRGFFKFRTVVWAKSLRGWLVCNICKITIANKAYIPYPVESSWFLAKCLGIVYKGWSSEQSLSKVVAIALDLSNLNAFWYLQGLFAPWFWKRVVTVDCYGKIKTYWQRIYPRTVIKKGDGSKNIFSALLLNQKAWSRSVVLKLFFTTPPLK